MSVADERLIRAYRRLVCAYPPGARRAELLDTLLDCAAPGRRRPAAREVVNLLCHGARARLGRPRSRGIVVLAVLIALAGGFLGACVTNRLGGQAVGSLPVGAEAAEIRDTIFPGMTVWGGGDAAKIVTQGDGDGVEYGYATSWVKHTPTTRDVAGYTAATRGRLEAAGWTVTAVDPPLDETNQVSANPGDRAEGFRAVRGTLSLYFDDHYWPGRPPYDSDGNATYLVWHRQPLWLSVVTWAGALLGALLAFLLTGWVSRRAERSREAGWLAAVAAVCCLLGLVPAALLAATPGQSADETESPFWQGLVYFGRTPALLSAGLALLILGGGVLLTPRPWRWVSLGGRGGRGGRGRRPRVWRLGMPAARWPALVTAVIAVIAIGAIGADLKTHRLDGVQTQTCRPVVPSGVEDPAGARLSYLSRVYLSPQATDDQRNLAEAAIGRGFGGGYTFRGGPQAAGFAEAYCDRGQLAEPLAEALPWYWTVDLDSPGLFGGLAAEVIVMPGVVAVQHVPVT